MLSSCSGDSARRALEPLPGFEIHTKEVEGLNTFANMFWSRMPANVNVAIIPPPPKIDLNAKSGRQLKRRGCQ